MIRLPRPSSALSAAQSLSTDDEKRTSGEFSKAHVSLQLPKVIMSWEVIETLENLAACVEEKIGKALKSLIDFLKISLRSATEKSKNKCSKQKQLKNQEILMELWPKSGIEVDYHDLSDKINMFAGNPNEMVRRLLTLILGIDELKKSTATGKGDTQGIPKNVFDSVRKFVNANAEKGKKLDERKCTRCITLFCGRLRRADPENYIESDGDTESDLEVDEKQIRKEGKNAKQLLIENTDCTEITSEFNEYDRNGIKKNSKSRQQGIGIVKKILTSEINRNESENEEIETELENDKIQEKSNCESEEMETINLENNKIKGISNFGVRTEQKNDGKQETKSKSLGMTENTMREEIVEKLKGSENSETSKTDVRSESVKIGIQRHKLCDESSSKKSKRERKKSKSRERNLDKKRETLTNEERRYESMSNEEKKKYKGNEKTGELKNQDRSNKNSERDLDNQGDEFKKKERSKKLIIDEEKKNFNDIKEKFEKSDNNDKSRSEERKEISKIRNVRDKTKMEEKNNEELNNKERKKISKNEEIISKINEQKRESRKNREKGDDYRKKRDRSESRGREKHAEKKKRKRSRSNDMRHKNRRNEKERYRNDERRHHHRKREKSRSEERYHEMRKKHRECPWSEERHIKKKKHC